MDPICGTDKAGVDRYFVPERREGHAAVRLPADAENRVPTGEAGFPRVFVRDGDAAEEQEREHDSRCRDKKRAEKDTPLPAFHRFTKAPP